MFKSDALLGNKLRNALTVLARLAVDAAYCRKFLAVRLADVKDVRRAKSDSR